MIAGRYVAGTRQRLSGLWHQSLVRTGHLLVANSMLNAATGVGYWLLAARLNPPEVVGINSAAISAMMLLGGIAQLNLMSALLRFVPAAGPAAGAMIRSAYLVGSGLSGLVAVVFLLGLHTWAPDLSSLLGPGLAGLGFVLATMCFALFAMQDGALVAVGRPAAVPIENSSFAVLKILLVVAFSLAVPSAGIWLSWTVAMAIAVAGTTWYLFWRAVPAFSVTRQQATVQVESARDLGRFIGPDYLGAVAWMGGTFLVPLLVLDLTGPRRSAAFALSWSICAALYQVPAAFGQSLVAHGAVRGDRLSQYHRQALQQTLRLLVPVVALIVVFAPVGLGLFGHWYAVEGTTTLRLLALSALPAAVVALAVSRARVARHMTTVMALLIGLSGLVLALTVVLVPRLGIEGAGVAYLAAQLVMAAVVFVQGRMNAIRSRRVLATGAGVSSATVSAALAGSDWECEEKLPTVSDSAVIMVRSAHDKTAVLKLASTRNGVESLHREQDMLSRLRSDERLGMWRDLLPVPLQAGDVDGGAYLLTSRLPGQDGRRVAPSLGSLLTPAAVNAITPLHRSTSTVRVADDALLWRLVDEPAERLRKSVRRKEPVDRLVTALRTQLAGRSLTLGMTHGDFYLGNVLVDPAGRITGIVDWGQVHEDDLVILDIAFWLLTIPKPAQPREFGARVAARLDRGSCWWPAESDLLATFANGCPVSGQALLLLAWLRHVTDNLAKSDRYAASPVWSRRNILPVLRRTDELDPNGGERP
jgi:O-antigen/teichoic acid export membrane protein/aminoglycoside phosphotransferase (APT) family kinase protein